MTKAGSGKREGGRGRPESGGRREKSADLVEPTLFGERMRVQGMVAPSALADSMRRASDGEMNSAGDALRAAEQLLDRVLAGECESRESALDLLTVDALVTRAMEIAARDPDSLAEFPELAMKRISTR